MRLVVQRVDGARVLVDGEVVGAIEGPGLCVLVGATHDDTPELAARLADKVYDMRLFDGVAEHRQVTAPPAPPTAPAEPADSPAPAGAGRPREVGAADLGLPVLVVSQFTLYGRTTKGRRPTWEDAAPAAIAEPLVAAFSQRLRQRGATVAEGRFGATMRVELVNDGPMTVLVEG